jgi:uncharacterized protein (TIGR02270 family)
MLLPRLTIQLAEQSSDDVSYLWLLRDQAVLSPNYDKFDMLELDTRIETFLDSLRLAGGIGWQACENTLTWQDAGEVFTGIAIALNQNNKTAIKQLLNIASQSIELSRGVVSALAWVNDDEVRKQMVSLRNSDEPMFKRIGLAASALIREDLGTQLDECIKNQNPIVRARALKAAGELGRVDVLDSCVEQLENDDSECQFWSAWCSALLGESRLSIEKLKMLAVSRGTYSEQACDLAGRCMTLEHAQAWLQELGKDHANVRLAVVFAGALGMPVLVSWLINMMTIPTLARKAGESFTNITGADFVEMELAGEEPEGFEAGPTENPEDEFVKLDADEDLPWPDVNKVAQWWADNKDKYSEHDRYLCGLPISAESLSQVISFGKQTNRHAAALELALMSPGKPLIDVRACSINSE